MIKVYQKKNQLITLDLTIHFLPKDNAINLQNLTLFHFVYQISSIISFSYQNLRIFLDFDRSKKISNLQAILCNFNAKEHFPQVLYLYI